MLKQLYQLQQLELAVSALEAERVNSDEFNQLRSLRASFEATKQKLAAVNGEIARREEKIKSCDNRRLDLEARIDREKKAIYDGSVTRPKELDARNSQLAALQNKLEAAEQERAEHLEQLAKDQDKAGSIRRSLTEMQTEFSRIRDIYQVKQEERSSRGRLLEDQKTALLQEVDESSLAWYEAHRSDFGGTPIACLSKERICSGCHTLLPLSTYKRAAQGQKTVCENCGRTLFVDN